jgi:hypothetical protein
MDTKSACRDAISAQILAGRRMNFHLTVRFWSLIPGANDEHLWTGFFEASFMAMMPMNAGPQRRNVAHRKKREKIATGADDRLRWINTMRGFEGIDAAGLNVEARNTKFCSF